MTTDTPTRQQREQAFQAIKDLAESDPEEPYANHVRCWWCHKENPAENGHNENCIWIKASRILYPPRRKVDQPRQDVHDFLVQLQTYRSHPDPISMTIETMTANLGTQTMERIEQAVMKRLLEVHPAEGREYGGLA